MYGMEKSNLQSTRKETERHGTPMKGIGQKTGHEKHTNAFTPLVSQKTNGGGESESHRQATTLTVFRRRPDEEGVMSSTCTLGTPSA